MNEDKTCADCAHYNEATIPGVGLCMATLERTFRATRCFNRKFKDFSPRKDFLCKEYLK